MQMSDGFSIAAITRAARRSFSQVLRRLIIAVPADPRNMKRSTRCIVRHKPTVVSDFVNVLLHLEIYIGVSEMYTGCQHLGHIVLFHRKHVVSPGHFYRVALASNGEQPVQPTHEHQETLFSRETGHHKVVSKRTSGGLLTKETKANGGMLEWARARSALTTHAQTPVSDSISFITRFARIYDTFHNNFLVTIIVFQKDSLRLYYSTDLQVLYQNLRCKQL